MIGPDARDHPAGDLHGVGREVRHRLARGVDHATAHAHRCGEREHQVGRVRGHAVGPCLPARHELLFAFLRRRIPGPGLGAQRKGALAQAADVEGPRVIGLRAAVGAPEHVQSLHSAQPLHVEGDEHVRPHRRRAVGPAQRSRHARTLGQDQFDVGEAFAVGDANVDRLLQVLVRIRLQERRPRRDGRQGEATLGIRFAASQAVALLTVDHVDARAHFHARARDALPGPVAYEAVDLTAQHEVDVDLHALAGFHRDRLAAVGAELLRQARDPIGNTGNDAAHLEGPVGGRAHLAIVDRTAADEADHAEGIGIQFELQSLELGDVRACGRAEASADPRSQLRCDDDVLGFGGDRFDVARGGEHVAPVGHQLKGVALRGKPQAEGPVGVDRGRGDQRLPQLVGPAVDVPPDGFGQVVGPGAALAVGKELGRRGVDVDLFVRREVRGQSHAAFEPACLLRIPSGGQVFGGCFDPRRLRGQVGRFRILRDGREVPAGVRFGRGLLRQLRLRQLHALFSGASTQPGEGGDPRDGDEGDEQEEGLLHGGILTVGRARRAGTRAAATDSGPVCLSGWPGARFAPPTGPKRRPRLGYPRKLA